MPITIKKRNLLSKNRREIRVKETPFPTVLLWSQPYIASTHLHLSNLFICLTLYASPTQPALVERSIASRRGRLHPDIVLNAIILFTEYVLPLYVCLWRWQTTTTTTTKTTTTTSPAEDHCPRARQCHCHPFPPFFPRNETRRPVIHRFTRDFDTVTRVWVYARVIIHTRCHAYRSGDDSICESTYKLTEGSFSFAEKIKWEIRIIK